MCQQGSLSSPTVPVMHFGITSESSESMAPESAFRVASFSRNKKGTFPMLFGAVIASEFRGLES